MLLRQVSRLSQMARKFSTTALRRVDSQDWKQYGVPGSNIPFDITNRYKLTAYFCVYFGIGFNAPFLLVIHQFLKHAPAEDE
ncbi:hypothetical protein BaRGS_00010945 [Batillaria attramentaria]|uniref:Cytochrome c oxidase subunit 7C, mitochondrial n=1 Tax=Batillaria attramentaria TaxID=370345 RepID=A0ABD0LEN9_9CAEN